MRRNIPMPPFIALCAASFCAACCLFGCQPAQQKTSTPAAASQPASGPTATAVHPVVTQASARQRALNPLDARRAFGYLTQLCNQGPRPSGSAGMARQQKIIEEHFRTLGGHVSRQEFRIRQPLSGKNVECANILIEWHPERTERVLVCTHYDTRPLPDQDPNPRRQREGIFIGANDGASGVAVLMELAHHMADIEPHVGVDFLLFDAEELVYGENVARRQLGEYFLGSKFFAREYRKNPPPHRYRWGILLDMVGDAQLEIKQEQHSVRWRDTRPLVTQVWTIAGRLGVKEFSPRLSKIEILDDHVPLHDIARIPTIDLIDAEYPDASFGQPGSYWHTEQDLPRHCSGESLAKVGWVVLEWLREVTFSA